MCNLYTSKLPRSFLSTTFAVSPISQPTHVTSVASYELFFQFFPFPIPPTWLVSQWQHYKCYFFRYCYFFFVISPSELSIDYFFSFSHFPTHPRDQCFFLSTTFSVFPIFQLNNVTSESVTTWLAAQMPLLSLLLTIWRKKKLNKWGLDNVCE